MLKITQEQMTLAISEEEGFVNWYVNDFMPNNLNTFYDSFTQEDLYRMVRNGRNHAIKQHFTNPTSQVHFVTFMWQIGANFYQFPGFKEVINTIALSEEARINQLYNEITEVQIDKAKEEANDHYWFLDTTGSN